MSLSRLWKLYYQAKFKLFLLKKEINKGEIIVIDDIQPELIIISDSEISDSGSDWKRIQNNDEYKDIDFDRYVRQICVIPTNTR